MPTYVQDLVMLELINSLDRHFVHLAAIREGFESTIPDGKLRDLLAEELVHEVKDAGILDHNAFDYCDDVVGFPELLPRTLEKCGKSRANPRFTPRLDRNVDEDRDSNPFATPWQDFMVAGGPPEAHWMLYEMEWIDKGPAVA